MGVLEALNLGREAFIANLGSGQDQEPPIKVQDYEDTPKKLVPTESAQEFFVSPEAPVLTPEAANQIEFRTGVPVPQDLRDLPDAVRGPVLGTAVDAGALKVVPKVQENDPSFSDPRDVISDDNAKDAIQGAGETAVDATQDAIDQGTDAAQDVTVTVQENTPDAPEVPNPFDGVDEAVDNTLDALGDSLKVGGLILLALAVLYVFVRAGGISDTVEAAS